MRTIRPIADPRRYGFAVGRVRVLETKLLTGATYERLLDAPSFFEQKRILSETPYGGYLEAAKTAEDVEHALDEVLADLYADFVDRSNLPEPVATFFRVGHDYENLRGRLKAEALGIPAEDLIGALGSVPRESFLRTGGLPDELRKAESRIRSEATTDAGELDLDLLDPAVDREMYSAMVDVACEASGDFLCSLARFLVDAANVRTFVRTRAKGLSAGEAEGLFSPAGNIPVDAFFSAYKLPLSEGVSQLATQAGIPESDAEALAQVTRVDVVLAKLLAKRTREASMTAVGPEPVVAYVLARRAEVEMLRVLLVGKIAGVPKDVLRSRLRDGG